MDRELNSDNKIKPNPKEILKEFKIKQRDFERKLEFNNNSDPLALWYNHLIWIWDNSEIVDNDQKLLINLIEKCIEKFASDSKYKNDIRFYTIFYKYTQITSDPDDVYDSIYSLSLFDKLAKFYISWSWVLANLNRDEKALEVLNLGIEKKAEPLCLLIQAKDELENKLKEKKSFYSTEQPTSSQSNEKNRSCLSINRKSLIDRKSIEPTSTTINSFAPRLSLSSKSLNRSTTPKGNLFLKSTLNKQGFEILEEDSNENRLSTENELNQQNKVNKLKPLIVHHSICESPKQQISSNHHDSKVKQNLIEKLRPLEEEFKIVIHEKLKSNQRFYADMKRIYKDTNTEYSFEEIRMRKSTKLNKLKQNKPSKESIANIELIKEIEMLKAKLKENEKREKDKESLQNQVDMLKKQIDMIIAQSLTTQSSTKRCLDEVDYGSIDQEKTKKLKLRPHEINQQRQSLKRRDNDKEELTIVRDMWNSINGTFASQNSPANYNNYTELNNREQQLNTNQHRKEFSIFKDATQTQFIRTNDFSYYPQMLSTTAAQDCFTIALPHDPSEFKAKLVSTPAGDKKRKL